MNPELTTFQCQCFQLSVMLLFKEQRKDAHKNKWNQMEHEWQSVFYCNQNQRNTWQKQTTVINETKWMLKPTEADSGGTSRVRDQGNVSPVVLLLGQEWCWVGRVCRTAGFTTLLLDGDWLWVSIFLVRSAFLITATRGNRAIDKGRDTTISRDRRWAMLN